MKYIKTFEQFVNESALNESAVNELSGKFKAKKPSKSSLPFFFQIHAREKDKDGNREQHKVNVGKDDDYNEVKRQVLKDYPHNKYYYTVWQNVRGGFKNIGTNESEELSENFINEISNEDKYYIVSNGFTFTTVDNKKFTIPRKAEIEINKSNNKTVVFKITKGKLDGYPVNKINKFEVTKKDFDSILKDGDIEVNEDYQFISEEEFHYSRLVSILEKRGVLDIIAPDLGGSVRGGRADKAYYKAAEKLKAAGFKMVDSTSSTSQSSGNVSNTSVYQHSGSPTQVVLSNYIGYTSRDNSFSYSFSDKPMSMSIKNDSEYKERISNYGDLSELSDVLYGIKVNRYGWDETESVDKKIKDYILAELRAIADYNVRNSNVKKFLKMGIGLADDGDFKKFVEERGCIIKKNYLGRANNIQVTYNSKLKPDAQSLSTHMGKNLFTDSRIGFAYVKTDDKSDVDYLISQLLKLPPIF